MKKFGIISYNKYGNFTNYGSALQTWALYTSINNINKDKWKAILIDYCPDCLLDKHPLKPLANMWDEDEESKKMCELSFPAIETNYYKFEEFYNNKFVKTKIKYTSDNFNEIVTNEQIDGFVCGSDTIFCIDEFGFDDGFYSNYPIMKEKYSVSYAASFGDSHFTDNSLQKLNSLLKNFNYITLREYSMLNYVNDNTLVPVKKVLDPTLLLTSNDYECIISSEKRNKNYLLLYSRRYDENMNKFAEKYSKKNNWEIIEISLRAVNAEKHEMCYEAGVEEFLSLVKHAEFVVTNSYHGMIFSIQFNVPFYIFSREQCNTKIHELLDRFDLKERLIQDINKISDNEIDFDSVHDNIKLERKKSIKILTEELNNYR